MKKVIRLKVKHIVSAVFITFFLGMIVYFSIPPVMLAIGNRLNQNGELLKAQVYYDRINELFPTSVAAETALESSAHISAVANKILIASTGYGHVQHPVPYVSNETKMYYDKITSQFMGSFREKKVRYQLLFNDVREKIHRGHIEEAVDIVKNFYINLNNEERKYIDHFTLIGIIRAFEVNGHYDEAEDLLSFIINYENGWDKTEFKNLLEQIKRSRKSSGKVTGSVSLQGKPFKDLPIFLQIQEGEDRTSFGYTHDAYWSKTDKNGNFEFDYVPEGRYAIGLVADLESVSSKVLKGQPFDPAGFHIVSDETNTFHIDFVDKVKLIHPIGIDELNGETIKFQWEPLDEAAYYQLIWGISSDFGTAFATAYKDSEIKYYTPEALIPKEDLYYMEGMLGFEEEGPIAEAFLARLNPNTTIFWGINAYDENDQLISSSNGFVKDEDTTLPLEKIKLTKADQKLIARDYQGAIEAYQESIEKDPEDVHALLMLARLYGFEDDHPSISYEYTDIAKSKVYYKKLYDLTKSEPFLDKL